MNTSRSAEPPCATISRPIDAKQSSDVIRGPLGVAKGGAGRGGRLRRVARARRALAMRRRIIERLRVERWSTNRMPSRWSTSCCRQRARRPSASSSAARPGAVEVAQRHPVGAGHLAELLGQAQAALLGGVAGRRAGDDLGVDHEQRRARALLAEIARRRRAGARRPAVPRARCPARRTSSRACRRAGAAARRRCARPARRPWSAVDPAPRGCRAGPSQLMRCVEASDT